ncbi:MAG: hypothetical protein M0Q02_07690 [Candidatus Muirbacterium halophilum]|nr:hypothetical protein [Candidatus Muirbacterium halophilum]
MKVAKSTVIIILVLLSILISENTYSYDWESIKFKDSLYYTKIIVKDPDDIIMLTDKGIFNLSNSSFIKISEDIAIDSIIFNDRFIVSKTEGIYSFSGNEFVKMTDIYAVKLLKYKEKVIFYNHQGLFFMENSANLSKIENDSINTIKNIWLHDDYVMISTLNGLYRYNGILLAKLSENIDIVFSANIDGKDYFISENGSIFVFFENSMNKVNINISKGKYFYKRNNIFSLSENGLFYFNGEKKGNFLGIKAKGKDFSEFYDIEWYEDDIRDFIYFFNKEGVINKFVQYKDEKLDDFNTQLTRAKKIFYSGNIDESDKILKILYQEEPNNFEINLFLAKIRRHNGDFYKALEYLSHAFSIKKNSELFLEFAGIELELGNHNTSYQMLTNAMKYSPDSFNIYVSIIENLIRNSKFEEAEYYINITENRFGKGFFLNKSMVRVLKAVNKKKELEVFFKKIMFEDRDNHEYVLWYADLLMEDFNFKAAYELLENNIERFNAENMKEYELRKIRINIELKKYVDTEKLLMDVVSGKSPDYRYYVYTAYLYMKINNYGLCEKYLSAAQSTGMAENDWLYNYMKGYMYLYNYKLSEAIQYLEKSLFLNADFPYTRYYIADIFIRKRMFFRASRELKIIMDYWNDFEFIDDVYKKYRELK